MKTYEDDGTLGSLTRIQRGRRLEGGSGRYDVR